MDDYSKLNTKPIKSGILGQAAEKKWPSNKKQEKIEFSDT
jgi:hypothetical protein